MRRRAKETTKAMKAATDEYTARAEQRSSDICPRLIISPLTETLGQSEANTYTKTCQHPSAQ